MGNISEMFLCKVTSNETHSYSAHTTHHIFCVLRTFSLSHRGALITSSLHHNVFIHSAFCENSVCSLTVCFPMEHNFYCPVDQTFLLPLHVAACLRMWTSRDFWGGLFPHELLSTIQRDDFSRTSSCRQSETHYLRPITWATVPPAGRCWFFVLRALSTAWLKNPVSLTNSYIPVYGLVCHIQYLPCIWFIWN